MREIPEQKKTENINNNNDNNNNNTFYLEAPFIALKVKTTKNN